MEICSARIGFGSGDAEVAASPLEVGSSRIQSTASDSVFPSTGAVLVAVSFSSFSPTCALPSGTGTTISSKPLSAEASVAVSCLPFNCTISGPDA